MYTSIIQSLERNQEVFTELLIGIPPKEHLWSQEPGKWTLLEILCHLRDEEVEDFRTRVKYVLKDPTLTLPSIDPVAWVHERKYIDQDYNSVLDSFIDERERSIKWLRSLEDPQWDNSYMHPKLGPMSAKLFLSNWLAHDLLHFNQWNRMAYRYYRHLGMNLNYAGPDL